MLKIRIIILQQIPSKTEQEIIESSMAEDDPHLRSCKPEKNKGDSLRWGQSSKGAQKLAKLYSRGMLKFTGIINLLF